MKVVGVSLQGDQISWAYFEGNLLKQVREEPLSRFTFKKKSYIATGLKAEEVLLRPLTLPVSKPEALYETLPFQLESLLPFPENEARCVALIKKMDKESAEIIACCCHENRLLNLLKLYGNQGIDPDFVSFEAKAISRFMEWTLGDSEPILGVYSTRDETLLVLAKEGIAIQSTVVLHVGDEENFMKELLRGAEYLRTKSSEPIQKWVELGDKKYQRGFSWKEMEKIPTPEHGDSPLPIGYALDAMAKDKKSLQFRFGKFTSTKLKKQTRNKWATLTLSLIAFTCLISGLKITAIRHEEMKLENEINPYKQHLPLTLQNASLEDISLALDREAPLEHIYRSPPLVSHLLSSLFAYLKSHREIQMKEISYDWKKYPSTQKPKEPFLSEVFMYFEAPSQDAAREFREYLENTSHLVMKNHPFTWTRTANGYEASFFLKSAK